MTVSVVVFFKNSLTLGLSHVPPFAVESQKGFPKGLGICYCLKCQLVGLDTRKGEEVHVQLLFSVRPVDYLELALVNTRQLSSMQIQRYQLLPRMYEQDGFSIFVPASLHMIVIYKNVCLWSPRLSGNIPQLMGKWVI